MRLIEPKHVTSFESSATHQFSFIVLLRLIISTTKQCQSDENEQIDKDENQRKKIVHIFGMSVKVCTLCLLSWPLYDFFYKFDTLVKHYLLSFEKS